jgi:hypothetical protein
MAREKAGEADYQIAIDYCERSYKMSVRARRLAARKVEPRPAGPAAPRPASGE